MASLLRARDALAAKPQQAPPTPPSDDEPVTVGQLKAILQDTLRQQQRNQQGTYAAAAARLPYTAAASTHAAPHPNNGLQVVPERRTREVTIKATGQKVDLAKRSAVEVVQAANTALGGNAVVAARRLQSGDTVLTFRGNIPEAAVREQGWVRQAFGETARLQEREFAVIAKGLPASQLRSITDAQLLKELQATEAEITRCKVERRRDPAARFATVVLHIRNINAARGLCDRGLV